MSQPVRQIYFAQTVPSVRYEVDPDRGMVQRVTHSLRQSDTDRIVFADGRTFEVGDDCTFMVPSDVAAFFLRQPGWYEGPNPFAPPPVEVVARGGRRSPVAA